MRCSVEHAMRLPSEDFDNAYIAASAINIARSIILEREAKARAK